MTLRTLRRLKRIAVLLGWTVLAAALSEPGSAIAQETTANFIDVHVHAHPQIRKRGAVSFDTEGAAENVLSMMNDYGVSIAVVMPPPLPPGRETAYDYEEMKRIVARDPSRLVFLAGGGTLNPIIQDTAPENVTSEVRARFKNTARAILNAGAHGFGELTALHFSLRQHHPFERVSPDHPLLLLLADIAAQNGVPIDLHMEAVVRQRRTPRRILRRGEGNPERLAPNIDAFERLLDHNKRAPIIWSHAGWDNTGQRTPRLMRRLLSSHPNLYMSIKLAGRRKGNRARKNRQGRRGAGRGNPLMGNGQLKRNWLELFQEFPDRFLIGSDTHVYTGGRGSRGSPRLVAHLLRQLPLRLARRIGYENARRLFRLH